MKRVLVIEDDRDTLDLLGYIVQEAEIKIDVVLRSDVLPVSEIEKINPNLILLDHWIGQKKGADLCLEIKNNRSTQNIPVILLSAVSDIGQIAFNSNADGCLMKPFDIEEIQEVIETYV